MFFVVEGSFLESNHSPFCGLAAEKSSVRNLQELISSWFLSHCWVISASKQIWLFSGPEGQCLETTEPYQRSEGISATRVERCSVFISRLLRGGCSVRSSFRTEQLLGPLLSCPMLVHRFLWVLPSFFHKLTSRLGQDGCVGR